MVEIILCDECDAVWLKGMNIFYGEYEKIFILMFLSWNPKV